jgi:hypothetical protein
MGMQEVATLRTGYDTAIRGAMRMLIEQFGSATEVVEIVDIAGDLLTEEFDEAMYVTAEEWLQVKLELLLIITSMLEICDAALWSLNGQEERSTR